ncbi:MAG TPA: hypothetical protein VMP68_18065 [Candidatus Eisenbacteria bacterium]|nr:hypothetical protein [Candidatus Eisenbacteria bacterium]
MRVATLPLTEHPEVASKGLQDYLAMKKAQEAKLQQKLDAKKPSLDDLMKTVNSLLKENE